MPQSPTTLSSPPPFPHTPSIPPTAGTMIGTTSAAGGGGGQKPGSGSGMRRSPTGGTVFEDAGDRSIAAQALTGDAVARAAQAELATQGNALAAAAVGARAALLSTDEGAGLKELDAATALRARRLAAALPRRALQQAQLRETTERSSLAIAAAQEAIRSAVRSAVGAEIDARQMQRGSSVDAAAAATRSGGAYARLATVESASPRDFVLASPL